MRPQQIALQLSRYLLEHPEEILRALRNAAGLKLGIPLDALRWFVGQMQGKKAPKEVEVEAVPPALRMSGTLRLMGTEVRASAKLAVESIALDGAQLRAELSISELALKALGESDSPLATLLKSGALDLSKPGNLIQYLPKRPAFLVGGSGDRITVDLMKHPAIARSSKARRAIALITPLVTIGRVATEDDHLCISLHALRGGLRQAIVDLKSALRSST